MTRPAESSTQGEERPWLWRALLGLLATFVLYRMSAFELSHQHGLLVDDAYISVRHVDNWLSGKGLSFNQHERVEGYSNFLFMLLLAIPRATELELVPFVRALGFLSAVGCFSLTGLLMRRTLGVTAAMLGMTAMALDPRFAYFADWGLETIFVTLPYLLGFLLLFDGKPRSAGLTLALAAMTRIETVLLLLPAVAYLLTEKREWSARRTHVAVLGASFGVPFVSYFCWRWWYYGWLLPNTFYAKVGTPGDSWRRGVEYVKDCLEHMGLVPSVLASLAAWLAYGVALVVLRKCGAPDWSRARRAWTILAAAALYFGYIVAVGGDHFQERFVYHALPLLVFVTLAPWALGAEWLARARGPRAERWGRMVIAAAGCALVVPLATRPARFGSSDSVAGWMSLGNYLRKHAPRGAVLATDAAGALPYFSRLESIDILGLADVHIAHRAIPHLGTGPAGHEKSDPGYVLERAPLYISTWLDPDGQPGRGFGTEADFHELYRLSALVRVDSSEVTDERVLRFATEPTYPEIVALTEGRGSAPGLYRWALYERRSQRRNAGPLHQFPTDAFRSNLPGFTPSLDYVVSAPRGHVPTHIMWGPFARLAAGEYVGVVYLVVDKADGVDPRQRLCSLDVYDGQRSLTEVPMTVGDLAGKSADVPFHFMVDAAGAKLKYEFRLYCWGLATVTVVSVSVARQ